MENMSFNNRIQEILEHDIVVPGDEKVTQYWSGRNREEGDKVIWALLATEDATVEDELNKLQVTLITIHKDEIGVLYKGSKFWSQKGHLPFVESIN